MRQNLSECQWQGIFGRTSPFGVFRANIVIANGERIGDAACLSVAKLRRAAAKYSGATVSTIVSVS